MADKPPAPIYRSQGNSLFRTDAGSVIVKRGQEVPYNVNGAPTGATVADGDYGDIVVTAGAWSIDSTVLSAFGRNLIDDADAAAARTTLGLGYFATGTDAANLTGTVPAARLPAFTGGDVTSSAGSAVLAIGANKVTRAMLAQTAGAAILGATAAGNVADLTPAQAKTFLAITASDVSGLATVATSGSASDLGSGTLPAGRLPALTGDVTTSVGTVATTIANGAVGLAKMANVATGTVFYRKTAGSGAPEVQTLATLKADIASGDFPITGLFSTSTSRAVGALSSNGAAFGWDSTFGAYVQGKTGGFYGISFWTAAGNVIFRNANDTSVDLVFGGAGAFIGAVTGSNLSGTNTGDQTITLTGDLTGSGTGSFAATIAAGAVSLAKMANLAANSFIGNNTGAGATPIAMTVAQAKTLLAITETDVANLTTDLAAKAPVNNPQLTGVAYFAQPAPSAQNATATLTIAQLLTQIITVTSTTAVTLTLPTGTLTDAGILSGALANNEAFEWCIINLGSSSGAVTVAAGSGHTTVGGLTVAIGTSARFYTRKTATNTFVTYRIA